MSNITKVKLTMYYIDGSEYTVEIDEPTGGHSIRAICPPFDVHSFECRDIHIDKVELKASFIGKLK